MERFQKSWFACAADSSRHRIAARPVTSHRADSRTHPRQRFDTEPALLPRSMVGVGSGVIAYEEYASFAALGGAVDDAPTKAQER